jgi:SanA protein
LTTIFRPVKKLYALFILGIAGVTLLLLGSHWWVGHQSEGFLYSSVLSAPHNRVGLVLGTSRYRVGGGNNPYFLNRINLAVKLYRAGKVDYLIVSGDNQLKTYNEPREMLDALLEEGIPVNRIYLDYAGFRTLDSVVRSKEVFGQDSITIISQGFHNARAVFIARHHNIDAVAVNAVNATDHYRTGVWIREYLARVKALLDIYILNKQPRFLGEQIVIGEE